MSRDRILLLWMGCFLEIFGLLLAELSLIHFHRLTMTAFFGLGIPAVLAGMACYIVVVLQYIKKKGAI